MKTALIVCSLIAVALLTMFSLDLRDQLSALRLRQDHGNAALRDNPSQGTALSSPSASATTAPEASVRQRLQQVLDGKRPTIRPDAPGPAAGDPAPQSALAKILANQHPSHGDR